jgi:hypothetical protein
MKNIDFSAYLVFYNLVIGILIMIASEKFGWYAGYFAGSRRPQAVRLTRIAALTFGSCVALLSGGIFLFARVIKV